MKVLLFLFLLISSFSQAQETGDAPAPVVTSKKFYTVLGRGVSDRDTGDSIALTCVEFSDMASTQCKTISFVYFDVKNFESREIGNRYSIVDGALDETVEAAAKDLKKKIKRDFKYHHHQSNFVGILSYIGIFAVGGAVTCALNTAWPVLGAGAIWVFLAHKNLDPAVLDPRGHVANVFLTVRENQMNQAMLSQEGWNWAIAPKVVSSKRFQKIVHALGRHF